MGGGELRMRMWEFQLTLDFVGGGVLCLYMIIAYGVYVFCWENAIWVSVVLRYYHSIKLFR
jgi:hypothetical protein